MAPIRAGFLVATRDDKCTCMIRARIRQLLNLPDAIIEHPENPGFGDYSTNAILKLAKKEGKNPLAMAGEIAQKLAANNNPMFAKIEAAPPGFINFTLSPEFLRQQVAEILKTKENYGSVQIGESARGGPARGGKIQVEFISANPTGPLTLGNGRGGVYGDVLGNILKKAGAEVVKEYYVNDAGKQMEVLMDTIKEGKGDYIELVRKTFPEEVINQADKMYIMGPKGTKKLADAILENMIQKTVAGMGINFDVWFSEKSELREKGKVEEIIKWAEEKDLAYKKDDALWFRATKFGDDEDRVLVKKDGQPTYFCVDAAYHKNKFEERKFDRVINIWGADHHGDVKRVKGFVEALGFKDKFEIILMQFVRLVQDGKPTRMSKREGVYVLVDDVLKEIGRDVFRFFMLMHSPNTHMDFDLDLAKEQSDKNPVYYVQYAYARICSILRKSGIEQIANSKSQDNHTPLAISYKPLSHPSELALIKQLIRLPEIIADTALDYQVHRLPQYSLDLVRGFHKFYEDCKVLDENNKDLTQSRLALCEATRIVLKNTLSSMGISALEKM